MHKTCPVCGYAGDLEHCPNDGSRLLTAAELAARNPREPTQAPPQEKTVRAHAPVVSGDATMADDQLRGADFGQWDAPEVRRKAAPKVDPMLGKVIEGRYEVQRLIGKGGMGAVYKARQTTVQRDIALKVLLEEFVENETVVKRFYQEALAASRLQHPNTIEIYDFGQTEDHVLYIAMEYLRGHSLAQLLARTPRLHPKRVIHIMRQVCKSLAEAHKAGIIHRDLKPDNIFLTDIQGERDFVKVLDFGVAKLKEYDGKEGTLTQAGMIFGTPKYMSPEQARSAKLDPRSDVYALGVILYEMLTGRAPFAGDNPLSILIAHVNEHAKRFAELDDPPDVPQALEAVVFRALSKNPDGRQPDTETLGAELEAVDQLLDGVDYESVADQLPQMARGADGQDSMVGPAILPVGRAGTVEGVVGGNTDVLLSSAVDPSGRVGQVTIDAMPVDPPRPASKLPLVLLLLLAVPLGFAAVWFGAGAGDGATDAARAARPRDAATVASAAPVDAGARATQDAQVAVAAPDAAPPGREIMVASDPNGARIVDVATGEQVGVTYARITVRRPSVFRLEKSGYTDKTFSVNPDDDQAKKIYRFELKAKASRPKRPKRPKRPSSKAPATRSTTVSVTPKTTAPRVLRPATTAPAGGGGDPIELQ